MIYIHFTDLEGAKNIRSSQYIKAAGPPFPDAVFAVIEGGAYVPGVQQTKLGRAKNRQVAVVFETKELPDTCFIEECLWHMKSLPVNVLEILPAKEAVDKYLDNTVPRDNETEELLIPMHPKEWDKKQDMWKRV